MADDALKQKFNLSSDDDAFISELDRMVVDGELKLDAYLVALEDEFSDRLSDEQRDALYTHLLHERFVPLGDRLQPTAMEIARREGLVVGDTSKPPSTALERAIEQTVARVSYRPPDDYLTKRLRSAISSRLRDVRSSLELKDLFMRDSKVGGLSLEASLADQVAQQVEESYREFRDPIAAEEKGKIEIQLSEQKQKVEERRRREAESHAKWFEEKVRARKEGDERQEQAIQHMRQGRAEREAFGRMVPVQADIRVSEATVELSKTSAARPSVDAVTHSPQLVGPIGELRSLGTVEFRRLAKDPQDAVKKIQQKIDTLGQESLEKRIEGIRGYQQSPLQQLYMRIVAESFRSAKPVSELAAEKRAAGVETLDPAEIAAIVQLNSTLHF